MRQGEYFICYEGCLHNFSSVGDCSSWREGTIAEKNKRDATSLSIQFPGINAKMLLFFDV